MSPFRAFYKLVLPNQQEVNDQGDLDGATVYWDPTYGIVVFHDPEADAYEATTVYSASQAAELARRLPHEDEDRLAFEARIADSSLPLESSQQAHAFSPAVSRIIAGAIHLGDMRLDEKGVYQNNPYQLTSRIGVFFFRKEIAQEAPFAFVYGPCADGSGYATYLVRSMRHLHAVMHGTNWDAPASREAFKRIRQSLVSVLPNNHPDPETHAFPGSLGLVLGVGFDTLDFEADRVRLQEDVARFMQALVPHTAPN